MSMRCRRRWRSSARPREAIDEAAQFGDADTADVFTEISRETDKQLWLVESHLHG
jgi:starvation-inducible DNA-binding protein